MTESISDVDAVSPSALALIARRKLTELQRVAAELTFECAWIPHLAVDSVVRFTNGRHDVSGLWEISAMRWAKKTASLVSVTARSVT